jgi:hypothetical protein
MGLRPKHGKFSNVWPPPGSTQDQRGPAGRGSGGPLLDRRRWTKALSRCRPCSPKPRFARSVPCWFGAMAATNCMGGSNRPSPLLRLASVRAQVSERRHPPVPRKAKQPPPPGVEKQGCIHSGRLSDPDRLPEGADGEDRSQTLTCEARAQ